VDRIDAMRAFVTVATEGSFTKAADRLGLSNQLVSKYVSQLEEHLGVRLLNRTTRRVQLTEAGRQCLQYTQEILESIQDMEGQLGSMQSEAQGLLRISAPASFSTLHLAPMVCDFRRAHPAVRIDLELNDRKVDLVEENFDVALRIGRLQSSSLIARQITPIRLVVCASPGYLKRYGTPGTPADLRPEHYLHYSFLEYDRSGSPLMEVLKANSRNQHTRLICNNGEVLVKAAIAGEGYVLQPTFMTGEAIRQGQLEVILREYAPEPLALYAVYPHRKLLATKLRAFIDFMATYFGNPPYWDRFE